MILTRTRQDIYKILKIHFGSGWSGLGDKVKEKTGNPAGMWFSRQGFVWSADGLL
jgi:hypothetical protein